MLLDHPGRLRSQIISVVCQIQWLDFDCNLVGPSAAKSNNTDIAEFRFKYSHVYNQGFFFKLNF